MPPDELELLDAPLEVPPELEAATGGLVAGVTCIEKPGSAVDVVPSLAAMMMPEYLPVSDALGVPESCPVNKPKLAHEGLF